MKFFKKWGALLVAIFMLAIIAVLVLLGMQSINKYKATIANQQASIDSMSSFIDNDIGPLIDCYVVTESVRVGDEITEENITAVQVPEKIAYTLETVMVESTNEKGKPIMVEEKQQRLNLVTNANDVIGKKFRVHLNEGSILLSDFVIEEPLSNSDRYYQLCVDDFPTNIDIGDYVDLRIQFVFNEDFIALPHLRIVDADLGTGLFTFIFDEQEINTYNSMLLDKALYGNVRIYMLKYVDSDAQPAAESWYPLNNNISDILTVNPNILEAVKEEMQLERAELNALMGGDIDTYDAERLEEVREYLADFRKDTAKDVTKTLNNRLKAEAAAAKAAAKSK